MFPRYPDCAHEKPCFERELSDHTSKQLSMEECRDADHESDDDAQPIGPEEFVVHTCRHKEIVADLFRETQGNDDPEERENRIRSSMGVCPQIFHPSEESYQWRPKPFEHHRHEAADPDDEHREVAELFTLGLCTFMRSTMDEAISQCRRYNEQDLYETEPECPCPRIGISLDRRIEDRQQDQDDEGMETTEIVGDPVLSVVMEKCFGKFPVSDNF